MTQSTEGGFIRKLPLLKTLAVCTRASRASALAELFWIIGVAFLPVLVVVVIVLFSKPLSTAPHEVMGVLSRGELMIYAATVCGTVLYALLYSIEGPLPDLIREKATSPRALIVMTAICMFIATMCYFVRRMSDIHNITLNQALLDTFSVAVLFLSVTIAYVVFALKHSMALGAVQAPREQTEDFGKLWDASRDD